MRTLDQVRRSHASARPKHDNPAWLHTHEDLTFVLQRLDTMAHDCVTAIETARPLCDRDSHRRSAEYNQGLADGIARGLKIAVRAVRLVAESSSVSGQ